MRAITVFVGIALAVIGSRSVLHLITHTAMDPLNLFAESSTTGTILVLVVCLPANVAPPVYFLRHHRDQSRPLRNRILPGIGAITIGVPLHHLAEPAPYGRFPYLPLTTVTTTTVCTSVLVHREPDIADRVGPIAAGE